MKPTPRDVRWLVDQLDDQKRRLQNLENRKPGLAYSSIEDGAIREYDKDGTLGSQTGKQPDGTHGNVVYNGPPPPTPTLAKVAAVPGVVEVRWNGKFADDAVSPLDFKHVAAYVVAVGAPVVLSAQSGVMTGELGDALQVQVDAGVYDVYLAAWSLAGRYSALAGPASVVVPNEADFEELNARIEEAQAAINAAAAELEAAKLELDTRLGAAESDLAVSAGRIEAAESNLTTLTGTTLPGLRDDLAAAEVVLGALPADIAAAQSTATGAASDAAAAQLAAQQAQSAALEAASRATSYLSNGGFELDLDAWTVDGSAPTITSDAQSGSKAARFTTTQAIFTESFPASAGQWWEVSGWYKSDAATGVLNTGFGFQFKKADNSTTSGVVPEQSATGAAWAYVSFRVLVPAEAVAVRVRLARAGGTAFTVDSVVLRNVTEVVLLELAAAEAKSLAAAAKAVADAAAADVLAMASQVDGLQSDLAVNTVAIGQAASRLDELDSETLPALGVELGAAKDRLSTAESDLASNTGAIAAAEADLARAFGQIADVTSAANRAVTYGSSPPPGALPNKSLWVTPSGHTYISQEC